MAWTCTMEKQWDFSSCLQGLIFLHIRMFLFYLFIYFFLRQKHLRMVAFLLNKFCSRLAVYSGNYVIFVFILSIRPIPFSFMGGQAGNLPQTQWGEIAMPDTFQALHQLCALSLALFDYFFTVSLAHTLLAFFLCIPSFTDMHMCC